MPGAGKTTVGKELAAKLGIPFLDSDEEIEKATSLTIPEIFEQRGEPAFREEERNVLGALLSGPPCVLSTGGGAFMNAATRELIKVQAISMWLKADFDVLLARIALADNRPMFKDKDPEEVLKNLMLVREPVFAKADIVVFSENESVDVTVEKALRRLNNYLQKLA
jgi:shikimate kinase